MEQNSKLSVQVTFFLIIATQLALGFVRLDTTAQPPENPTKGFIQNVSLHHLTSNFLKHKYEDIAFLKISYSKIEKIDKYAFDYLTHLNLLEISNNEIQEEIDPQTFTRLPGLEILVLRNSGLRKINLNLTNVQELILAGNEIETIDARSIVCKNLNFIDLSDNNLKNLNGNFGNLSKLSMIDLSRNKISEIPNVFGNNVNLLRILASENRIMSTEGVRLPWVKTLDLFSNRITVLDSKSFENMKSLEELVLAFNNIQHVGDAFKNLSELKFLNLAWNHITEINSNLFRNNLYLTKLSLQGNNLKSLKKFQSMHYHLTHLDFSHNQISLLDDEFFASTPSLQVLDLSFNRLKTVSDVLAPLVELKILNLAFNNLIMDGKELSTNEGLTRVNLSSNSLQSDVTHFVHNLRLKELDLSNNEITDFCKGETTLKSLSKINLSGNEIKTLSCLQHFDSLCEVDLRKNPLECGMELDDLVLKLVQRKNSPYKLVPEFQADVLQNQCENLSLDRSLSLWNSIKHELCPKGRNVEIPVEVNDKDELEINEENEKKEISESVEPEKEKEKKPFIIFPVGWIKNDEMHKPNPLEKLQSERPSWEKIDENVEILKGFEDEELGKRPRFSWYTIALILIGLSLTLTCFNLAVFLYIRMKVWRRSDMISPQKYTILHNEVYKNTTEPTQTGAAAEKDWSLENQTRNKIFSYGKINEVLLNFGLNKKDKDSESAKNILINSSQNLQV